MKINQNGCGSWTSLCPICGVHFRVNFSNEKDFEESLDYGKKKKKEDREKYIENYHKLKKIAKHTFNNYNKITLLLPNSKVIHNVKYDDNNNFEKGKKHFGEVYFTKNPIYGNKEYDTYGLPMHTECWNLAKENYNHELKLDDFLFNKIISSPIKYYGRGYDAYLLENIKYGDILDYLDQDFYDFKLIPNEKHWYMYYLPSGESEESQKNSKRILKILNSIIKGIKKPKEEKDSVKNNIKKINTDRPSPAESATLFEVGKKKKGNDGNMYEVVEDKNKVKKWKIFKKDRPSPSESAKLFKVGTKKKGNDGNMYIIASDKNNVNRWKKI